MNNTKYLNVFSIILKRCSIIEKCLNCIHSNILFNIYHHKKDQWHQMEDLSSMANALVMGVGFTYKGYGYYTTGGGSADVYTSLNSDTWRFIPDVKETRRNDY